MEVTERLNPLDEVQETFRTDLKWNCEQLFLAMMRASGIDTTRDVVLEFVIALADLATDHLCEELDKFNEEVSNSTSDKMRALAEYGGFDWETFKSAVDSASPSVV